MQTKSDAELLSILGVAERKTGMNLYEASRMAVDELKLEGLTSLEATRLAAAFELGRRTLNKKDARPRLRTPSEIASHLQPAFAGLSVENFRVLCFNARNTLVRDALVATGTTNACPVDPREVFRQALQARSSAIVLAHNHPSGDPEPSSLDVALTAELAEGARLLGIRVLDHVVMGDAGNFVSFLERGLMPVVGSNSRFAAQKGWS